MSGERFLHQLCAVADDNHYIGGHSVGGTADRIEYVSQHWAAGNEVQYLWPRLGERGTHPLTLARSEYHDVHAL